MISKKKFIIGIIAIAGIIGGTSFIKISKVENIGEKMRSKLEEINRLCNDVISDLEGNEKKYLKLLEEEEDPLKRGIYYSVMSQINTIKGDSNEIEKYAKEAIKNYKNVEGGEYLAISEGKYLSWAMLRVGQYGESFRAASEALDLLKVSGETILTNDEIMETEALLYSTFLMIYSEFDLLEEAAFYNKKLEEMMKTSKFEASVGERAYYSQMMYYEKTKNYEIMKKYAEKIFNIGMKNKYYGDDTEAALILNVAIANISLNNIEEGFNQLEVSEKFFTKIGDTHTLASIYGAYAEGYKKIGENHKALEFYDRTLEIYEDLNDIFRKKLILKEIIDLAEKNNIEINLTDKYKEMYELENEVKENSPINQLLGESLAINERMSKNRIDSVLKEKELIESRNTGFLFVIIILLLMCYLMWRMYEKKKNSEEVLVKTVNRDYLTGASTRDYGFKEIGKLIKEKIPFSVAMIDIDNFKKINDTYGHLLGDEVLKFVADKLRGRLDEEHLLIRFGGEEFIIIFKNLNKEEGKFILDEVRKEIGKSKFKDEVIVSFSGGIDEFNFDDINKTLKIVDKLLYVAKNEGKNKIVLG